MLNSDGKKVITESFTEIDTLFYPMYDILKKIGGYCCQSFLRFETSELCILRDVL